MLSDTDKLTGIKKVVFKELFLHYLASINGNNGCVIKTDPELKFSGLKSASILSVDRATDVKILSAVFGING